jgi:hypothetical protein
MGRPRQGLLPCLAAVRQSLVPHLSPQGMVGEPFDLLGHAVPSEDRQDLDDAGMERQASFQEETAIGYLVGKGVLEGEYEVGKEMRLIQELCSLQVSEATLECLFRQLGNSL